MPSENGGNRKLTTIEELYLRYRGHLYRLCRRYLPSGHDADDLVQTVFLKAMRGLPAFKGEAGHFTWLYRITVNECLSYLKKNRHRYETYNEAVGVPEDDTAPDYAERRELWHRMLFGFGRTDRTVILLHAFEGVPVAEVAEILQVSRQVIHRRWSRIRSVLRQRIRRES